MSLRSLGLIRAEFDERIPPKKMAVEITDYLNQLIHVVQNSTPHRSVRD
jgi:hypothetical protein